MAGDRTYRAIHEAPRPTCPECREVLLVESLERGAKAFCGECGTLRERALGAMRACLDALGSAPQVSQRDALRRAREVLQDCVEAIESKSLHGEEA